MVTAEAIRDGEPEALARLCMSRGRAVLAYAEYVVPGKAGVVAAAAVAEFRARIAAVDGAITDPGALLLGLTRRAAAARSTGAGAGGDLERSPQCITTGLLVGWMEETLTAGEQTRFEEHVTGCADCIAMVARFEAAERAYEHPPEAPLPAAFARLIVRALIAAAPVTACGGDVAEARAAAELLVCGPRPAVPSERPAVAAPAPAPAPTNGAAAHPAPSARGPAARPPARRPLTSRLSFRARMAEQRAEAARQRAATTVALLTAQATETAGPAKRRTS